MVSSLSVKVDSKQAIDQLKKIPAASEIVTEQFYDRGSLAVMEKMRRNTPKKRGFLRESVTRIKTSEGFLVYPAAAYAEIVEKGSRPHIIFPASGKVLHRLGPWGEPIFVKKINHPGFPGRFFIRRTDEEIGGTLEQLFASILSENL